MTPMIRGNICLNAHPAGCEAAVQAWIARAEAKAAGIKANAKKAGKSLPGAVLVLGASTGYGLASRITAAFGCGAATIGVSMERQPSDKKPGTPGWYNNRAFDRAASKKGLFTKTIDADAFANETREKVIELAKEEGMVFDQLIYSLASPVRLEPSTGIMHRSVLKPLGSPFSGLSLDVLSGALSKVSIEPANEEETKATVKVMGGEDWELWVKSLKNAGLLSKNFVTLAYSYIGPSHTSGIYRGGTIGKAKEHLEKTAKEMNAWLKPYGGSAFVSINKAVVTRASSVIPVVALYVASLFKVMKEKNLHEDCLDQLLRLYAERLFAVGKIPTDPEGRIRMDDWEMMDEVQAEVAIRFTNATESNLREITDFDGFKQDFLEAHGFAVKGVNYDIEPSLI